jgi:hypothetical protein
MSGMSRIERLGWLFAGAVVVRLGWELGALLYHVMGGH